MEELKDAHNLSKNKKQMGANVRLYRMKSNQSMFTVVVFIHQLVESDEWLS